MMNELETAIRTAYQQLMIQYETSDTNTAGIKTALDLLKPFVNVKLTDTVSNVTMSTQKRGETTMKTFNQKTLRIDTIETALQTYEIKDVPPFTYIIAPWEVGQEVIPVERVNNMTGESTFTLYLHDGRGIPGNMDRNDREYHGWRGTTNNIATYVHGVRRIEKVEKVNGYMINVRIGKDLHPDW